MKPGERFAGRYVLLNPIGMGSRGVVLSARDIRTEREVALKIYRTRVPADARRRLMDEARVVGPVSHPNLVQVLDAGVTEEGHRYVVMELLEGETLDRRLGQGERLPEGVAARIGLEVASALRAAHAAGLVHRDLYLDNIFLHRPPGSEKEIVKVLGFGVPLLDVAVDADEGTPAYVGFQGSLSPEQIRGAPLDGRTDVWSLGVVLFEMLAGTLPFTGANRMRAMTRVLREDAPRIESVAPEVSRGLGDVIAGCLERDLSRRIGSADELYRRLLPFAGGALVFAEVERIAAGASADDRRPSSTLPPPILEEEALEGGPEGGTPGGWRTATYDGEPRFVDVRLPASLGFGRVYAAFDRVRGERVAIKTASRGRAGDPERVRREFEVLRTISHPHVPRVYDLFAAEDGVAFSAKWIEGRDFGTHDHGAFDLGLRPDLERVRSAFAQLVRALRDLHERGIVHGHLKPHNVLVTAEGQVVLHDFALATCPGIPPVGEAEEGRIVGTPLFMSPEVIRGAPATPASDLYAVGVMLYEALSGQWPWRGMNVHALVGSKLAGPPLPPSKLVEGVPWELDQLCNDLLDSDPGMRPPAGVVLRRLESAPEG